MVMTCRADGSGSSSGSGSGSRDEAIHDLIVAQVSRIILEDLSGMFGKIKEEMVVMLDEHLGAMR